jgi:hypothetical protein
MVNFASLKLQGQNKAACTVFSSSSNSYKWYSSLAEANARDPPKKYMFLDIRILQRIQTLVSTIIIITKIQIDSYNTNKKCMHNILVQEKSASIT